MISDMYENTGVCAGYCIYVEMGTVALLSHLGAITKVAEAGNTSIVKNNPP